MAVVAITTTMAGAINYTHVTDTSADWASVPNSTYFYDKADKLIHFKNSSGVVLEIFGTSGLTYFTEAQNTAAPNATVPVDSLTAVASTANADIALVPKGTGAFTLAIPDNTTTGGNKRGDYAVDFSRGDRDAADRVASGLSSFQIGRSLKTSGNYSMTLGNNQTTTGSYSLSFGLVNNTTGGNSLTFGSSCTTSGNHSLSFGSSCTASGGNSLSFGNGSTASGGGAIAIGELNTASSNNAFAIGSECIASNVRSIAMGFQTTASGYDSIGLGRQANTFGIQGRLSHSSGRFTTRGDSQLSKFLLQGRTTNNTATTLVCSWQDLGSTPGVANQVILSNQSAYRFKGTIIGKVSGTTGTSAWDIDGLIVRGANAASTTLLVGNVNVIYDGINVDGPPTLAADTTNGGLRVQVVGVLANIQWTAVIETTEVIYA